MKLESFTNNVVTSEDRMFVYLWAEKGNEQFECKFGERWVSANENSVESCKKRIRESLGVRKDIFDSGNIIVHSIWDVTDFAKKVNKYYKNSRVDDEIRVHIGHVSKNSREVHSLSVDDMAFKVNEFIKKQNVDLPKAGLARWQYDSISEIVSIFNDGKKTILMDAAARSGKTITIGALIVELNSPLTLISSYVLTSFTSFMVDLSSFSQFKNIVMINASDSDYKNKISTALKENKQCVVFLSLVKGNKNNRSERLDFLFKQDVPTLIVVDEADYGAWKPSQCDEMVKYRRENDKVILMTGTNSERAVGGWKIDATVQITYLEMLMEKKLGV